MCRYRQTRHGSLVGGRHVYLLSTPLTIPLVCCHINSFRRASRCGEAMARRRKEEEQAGSASRGMCSAWVASPPVCGLWGVPARGVVPERCNASGAAMDACRDAPPGIRWAEHATEGGVVDVPRPFSGSPRALRIPAQRVARFHPWYAHNYLPLKKLRRDIRYMHGGTSRMVTSMSTAVVCTSTTFAASDHHP